jgi:hypothetical protein
MTTAKNSGARILSPEETWEVLAKAWAAALAPPYDFPPLDEDDDDDDA